MWVFRLIDEAWKYAEAEDDEKKRRRRGGGGGGGGSKHQFKGNDGKSNCPMSPCRTASAMFQISGKLQVVTMVWYSGKHHRQCS